MTVHSGNELREYVNASLNSEFKERFLLKDLHSYMTSKNDTKVMCLYGLKNTGKATMALQEMHNLGDYDNMLHIVCGAGDKMYDINRVLDDAVNNNKNLKYVFIDEITKAERFIDTCSFLADAYSVRGIKVVLYGTNSLGFHLATGNELFDRAHLLHTTYIPFKEYNYVLGKGIDEYIEYGGTLTDGVNNVFYNSTTTSFYTNSAITDNICHSIHNWGVRGNYALDVLHDLDSHNELESFINKVVEYHNRTFLADVINKEFKSHDLGSLLQIMSQRTYEFGNPAFLDTKELSEDIRVALGIKQVHFFSADENMVEIIIHYLKALDVLYEIPYDAWLDKSGLTPHSNEKYIFTQVGMRYSQAETFVRTLLSEKPFDNYSKQQRELIFKTIDNDIKGGILEDIVFYQLSAELDGKSRDIAVMKYCNADNKEIDIVVFDFAAQSVCLIEVKHSSVQTEGQIKNLCDPELCAEIERKAGLPIVNKAVVYLGKSGEFNGVLYINVEEFLCHSQEVLQKMLNIQHISFKDLGTPTQGKQGAIDSREVSGYEQQ